MPKNNLLRTRNAIVVFAPLVLLITLLSVPDASAANKFKTLYTFSGGMDGKYAFGGLIFDSAGNLYGTTLGGGAHGWGTVFKLAPNENGNWTESVLHSFNDDGKDGVNPRSGVIFDRAGNLYGTTIGGGARGWGTVFKLAPSGDGSWKHSVLHSFNYDGTDGYSPFSGVIFNTAGNLYGTTAFGGAYDNCGTVFQLTPKQDGSWTESILYSFNCRDGQSPFAGLIFDQTGNLYGTTHGGGATNKGTVFQLSPSGDGGWTETNLHSFNHHGHEGAFPYASLIFDPAGDLYSTTVEGGLKNSGTVFRLTPNGDGSWTERRIHLFSKDGKDGYQPSSSVILGQAGNLFGTTQFGGTNNFGTVFKLESKGKGAWKETVLHSFKNHPGDRPYAGLIFDGHGNLYGTTGGDNRGTFGSVFEIVP